MFCGYGLVFVLMFYEVCYVKNLLLKLFFFYYVISFGGVESLIEWRMMMDFMVIKDFMRVSIGVESLEDLLVDFFWGLRVVVEEIS